MELNEQTHDVYQGRFGRTLQISVLISSASGPIFPAQVYTSINVTEQPELRGALVDGTLNRVACPFEEGKTYELALPVRYHDEVLELFALIVPEQLRHEEFKHRSELLQDLAKEREVLPDYVRNFRTIFSTSELEELIQSARKPEPPDASSGAQPEPKPEITVADMVRVELNKTREELERERERLEAERAQLVEVSGRLDHERTRIEELELKNALARDEIAEIRANLEREREQLERERQDLDQARLRQGSEAPSLAEGSDPLGAMSFDSALAAEKDHYVTMSQGRVIAAHKLEPSRSE
ncbi:MAG: CpXC domain-containing protein, partial [Myxococcota bacterium]